MNTIQVNSKPSLEGKIVTNIKRVLKERKMKQYQLAEDMGFSGTMLSNLLQRKRPLNVRTVDKFTKVLDVEIFELLL
jgi:transcriptional regulator with XRE-family HTH domain